MPRINATISDEILEKVKILAEKEHRSVSAMVEILLLKAIKEIERKKK